MYVWTVIVGGLFSFFAAMGIGANDAANAFASSVGSKALTIKQVVVIASIFETAGAVLMGSHVAETIRKGIADYECFEDSPDLLAYGCMWVVFSVGMWLFIASYYEMPVSTTHSCVGGMIGMAIALKGPDCVIWYENTGEFPYIGGVGGIILSWFISPCLSGLLSMMLFYSIRALVLRKEFESNRLQHLYPCLIGMTLLINTFFIIYKGAKGLGLADTPLEVAIPVAFGIALLGCGCTYPLVPRLKQKVLTKFEKDDREKTPITIEMTEQKEELHIKNDKELKRVIEIHSNAELFDEKTEEVFTYLQIFTAICDSFSHGANDVANAIGPFAAIFMIYQTGEVNKKMEMGSNSYWILGLGGVGIAIGLMTYGYKIIQAIGQKLCKITPSRGVSIELGSALVIIIGSRLKLPLSTTHCQVGSTVGVGFLENGDFSGINRTVFIKAVFGWLITCFIVAITTGLLCAQGTYSPSIE